MMTVNVMLLSSQVHLVALLMTSVPQLKLVSIECAGTHVIVVPIVLALFKTIARFVPVKKDMKETQILLVAQLVAELTQNASLERLVSMATVSIHV